jgi:hypothetical protein
VRMGRGVDEGRRLEALQQGWDGMG